MTLQDRIAKAIERITSGAGSMRVPVDDTDPDVVLSDCAIAIKNLDLDRDLALACHRGAQRVVVVMSEERDEAESQVEALKADLSAASVHITAMTSMHDERAKELAAFEFSLAKYAELEKQLREATEALGPAWLVGGVSLAEGIKRKVDRLEAGESATWGELEPRCTR